MLRSRVSSSRLRRRTLRVCLGLVAMSGAAAAAELRVFREGVDGYASTQDTYLRNNFGTNGSGSSYLAVRAPNTVWYEQQDGLIRFDELFGAAATQIPPRAEIHSATLTLQVTLGGDPASLYRMRLDWDEATLEDDLTDDPPFCAPEFIQPGPCEAHDLPTAALSPASPGSRTLDVTADLQAWSDGAPRYGWVLLGDGPLEVRVASSDASTTAHRPRLEVHFTPTPFTALSPDVRVALAGGLQADHGTLIIDVYDEPLTAEPLGPLPWNAALVGAAFDETGDRLLAFESGIDLGGGNFALPGDVWHYDGVEYTRLLRARTAGLPAGTVTDALSVGSSGELLLSFDTYTDLGGGLVVADEDLVSWDGSDFALRFDGSAAGVPATLDLDAAHDLGDGELLVSFDTAGVIGALAFHDDDLLRWDGSTWSLERDLRSEDAAWERADLDAALLPEPALGLAGRGWILAGAVAALSRRRKRSGE